MTNFPEERTRLATLGATVLFTGIFATASSGYAFLTVFGWGPWVPLLSLLWGGMIFNVDRLIIMTMHGSLFRRTLGAVPRVILASVIAVVIARPLELWIFAPEITRAVALSETTARQEATKTWQDAVSHAEKQYNDGAAASGKELAVAASQASFKAVSEQAAACREQVERAAKEYQSELDGTGGTRVPGDGPVYRAKYARYQDAMRSCEAVTKMAADASLTLDQTLGKQADRLKALKQTRDEALEKSGRLLDANLAALAATQADSLLARERALSRLSSEDAHVGRMSVFIMFLFWLVEVLPVIAKLMAGNNIYEAIVEERREASLASNRGAREALAEHVDAGRRGASLRAETFSLEVQTEEQLKRGAAALYHDAVADVIRAAKASWKVPAAMIESTVAAMADTAQRTLQAAHAGLSLSGLMSGPPTAENPSRSASQAVRVPSDGLGRGRQLVLSALIPFVSIIGITVALYLFLEQISAFSRINLGLAIGGGSLVTGLFNLSPLRAALSRRAVTQ